MSDNAAAESPLTIPLTGETALIVLLQEKVAAARGYADASRAPGIRRAYAADWAAFLAWCDARSATPLPADPRVVAVFLAAEAARGMAPMTIGRRLAAIGHYSPPE